MKKISIIGSGGSGKSTLAAQLQDKIGIEAYHLDALFWQPGWVETERSEWRQIQQSICNKSQWIMDGNYGGTLDVRLQHSDTIIFLDINRYTCLFRALWRSIKSYGRTRPGMAKGCPERLDFTFCKWIFDYPQTKKPTILKLLKALPRQQNVIILKSSRDVKNFLKNA